MKLIRTILALSFAFCEKLISADYWHDRDALIKKGRSMSVGSSLLLNSKERIVNDILMAHKWKEYDYGFENPEEFLPAQHFFKSRDKIEKSEVFKIIQKFPKGACLHGHDTALVSPEYLYNLTFKDNLYGCWLNEKFFLHFFKEMMTGDCHCQLLKTMRSSNKTFDDFLKSRLTLIVENPELTYPDINSVWNAFLNVFMTVDGMLGYKPVWKEYLYQVLKELYEDNVMYMEFRGILPQLYDLENRTYDGLEVLGIYQETIQEFKRNHPDFHGARFIYAPLRKVDNETADGYVYSCLQMLESYPDLIAGFDLVGQEDLGHPLIDFMDQLWKLKNNNVTFFFHAGETNWYGQPTDINLYDAILLNTLRIGHGYAILKHPVLYDIVKERQIAIEISPISNQVLKLVVDSRNHPGSVLIANNFPIVISSDDPSFWGAKALSYDWYLAFMGLASREDDLRFLKQLAINSIQFSAMKEKEKKEAFERWLKDWDTFIETILK